MPANMRVCSAEFHLSVLQTAGRNDYSDFQGMTIEEFVDFTADLGMEIWYGGTGPNSGKQSDMLHSSHGDQAQIRSIPGEYPPDFDERFVERAHLHGILAVAGYKMNAWPALVKLHPDWMVKDMPDGRELKPNESFVCYNSPFGKWLGDYLADQVERYNLDGVWFDDTQYGSRGAWPWPAGCICEHCAAKYKADTGRDLPERFDMSSLDFRKWVEWRYDNLNEFHGYIAERVREVSPDAIVNYNSYPRPNLPWTSANDLNPIANGAQYFIETDYKLLGPTLTAKIARARGDCEIWFFMPEQIGRTMGTEYPPYLDPVFSTLPSLAALVHGIRTQSVVDYLHPYGGQIKFTYDELKKRRPWFGGESIRQCGLHLSRHTRDFIYSHVLGKADTSADVLGQSTVRLKGADDYWKQFVGAAEMLEQKHVIYEILFDKSITPEGLAGYKTLVLPNSACLSDEQCKAIGDWVKGGGTLVSDYETSLYDELGNKRENFGLADVFGVDWNGTYYKEGKSGTIYVPQGEYKEKYGLWIGFCGQHTEIRPKEGEDLNVLYTLSVRRGFAGIDPNKDTHDSGHPGVVEHKWGKGKSIYISGDIGEGYSDHPLQRVRGFFIDLVKRGDLQVEVDCPSRILTHALYGENGKLNVHLYHRFCQMCPWEQHHVDEQQWSAIDEPFPVHDIKVKINGGGVKSARMPLRSLDLQVENGTTIFVPEVYLHDIVEVEL